MEILCGLADVSVTGHMRSIGHYASGSWIGSGDAFADALGFTDAELAENRRGRIPLNQASRIWRRASVRFVFPAVAFATLSAVAIVLALVSVGALSVYDVFGWALWLGYEPPMLYMPLFAVIAAALAVGVFFEVWFGIGQLRRLQRDLTEGRAAVVEGWPKFSSELVIGPNLSARCWLVLNHVQFELASNVPITLPTRGPCRIYHTPGSRMVLSVETA